MIKKLLLVFLVCLNGFLYSQETNVPDDNFENYLETHDADGNVVSVGEATSMGNGVANDDHVTTSRIENVTDLDISRLLIADATGLEDFAALQNFTCFENSITSIDLSKNTALQTINVGKNSLTSLDLSGNLMLTSLSCSRNEITTLNVSQNTMLETLGCSNNQLSSLDVTNNDALKNLYCYSNPLGSLDVTKNLLLEDLDCVDNQLTVLDVSQNLELQELQAYENSLTSLDVSKNVKLVELFIEDNQITSLDISKNTVLEDLSCAYNALTYLNIRNGNNTNLNPNDFDIRNNPGLTCVSVDDPTYATATFTRKDAQTSFSTFCSTTYVPDDNFETYLETHNSIGGLVTLGDPTSMGNGIANDDYIGTEKILNIKNLNISNQGITDLTGLEAFIGLEELRAFGNTVSNLDLTANINLIVATCSNMGLTTMDVSGLTALKTLELNTNQLLSIDVSSNVSLENLRIIDNQLPSIDVSANKGLRDLRIQGNNLISLDISANTVLRYLSCVDNDLTNLDVQNNVLLENLSCGKNQFTTIDVGMLTNLTDLFIEDTPTLTSLDVSSNVNLEDIGVDNNTSLTSLDLSNNTKLIEVYINNTSITALDFSNSPDLYYVECQNNALTSLNFKNGNTVDIDDVYITGNPNLSCITVDDPTASYLAGWSKDATANFAEYCRLTYVPNDNFEALLEARGFGNGIANDDYVYTALIENETTLIIQDNDITDLTGIEDFESLEILLCRRSNVETIDISNNTKLTHLNLVDNSLTTLDLSINTLLQEVYINGNPALGTVGISTLEELTTFNVSDTGINTIDASNNPLIRVLVLNDNKFTALDVSSYPSLVQVLIANNQLTSLNVANGNNTNFTWFDASGNPDLTCIQVDDVNGNFNLWTKDATANYAHYCELTNVPDNNFENYLETHDANGNIVTIGNALSMGNGIANDNQVATSKIETVTTLNIASQNIADLTGIEDFTALESLNCDYNDLTTLDLSNNTSLRVLDAAENEFTSIDVTGYLSLEEVNLRSNSITNLLVDNNPNLKKLKVGKNALTTLDVTACTQLEELAVHQNLLESLDVRNGNNNLITDFFVLYNPNLTCIQVDDPTATYLSSWEKDDIASFSEDCVTPVITLLGDNPQVIELGSGYTELGATVDDGVTNVVIDTSDFRDAVGSYTIRYNATDASGNVAIEVTRTVNVINSCPIVSLPANNFTITTTSETCTDKDNGTIAISAVTVLDYNTTINGVEYSFTSALTVDNLPPGTYPVCIAIEGFASCEQCFEMVIEEAESLTGKTELLAEAGTAKVNVEVTTGTAPYIAKINNKIVGEYTTKNFILDVQHGDELEVSSSVDCEGKLSTKVSLFDQVSIAPNPTKGDVTLTLPDTQLQTINVSMYNALGTQVSSGEYIITSGQVILPMKQLPQGIYFVSIDHRTTFKIVKQ